MNKIIETLISKNVEDGLQQAKDGAVATIVVSTLTMMAAGVAGVALTAVKKNMLSSENDETSADA